MTFIHPAKQNIYFTLMLVVLTGFVLTALIWLIFLYNETVSLTHGTSEMREKVKQVESQNSELKGTILALFQPDAVSRFALERGLVSDGNLEYSSIISEWVVASGR